MKLFLNLKTKLQNKQNDLIVYVQFMPQNKFQQS